jgi:hypothetical protein
MSERETYLGEGGDSLEDGLTLKAKKLTWPRSLRRRGFLSFCGHEHRAAAGARRNYFTRGGGVVAARPRAQGRDWRAYGKAFSVELRIC